MTTVADHLDILRCPVTANALRRATEEELEGVNQKIRDRQFHDASGKVVTQQVPDAVVSSDGRYLYRVDDGIYLLMAAHAIDTTGQRRPQAGGRNTVQAFYDEVGWEAEDDLYTDAALFEDLRPVSEGYRRHCNRRVNRHLPATGRYLVDAASGPIQYQDYLDFSEGYQVRVCVDFSIRALREVQRKLGSAALCVLGDVTNLPLKDGFAEGAVSLHTIYHVPKVQQSRAFTELHRVLKPGGVGVVVYSWGASFPVRVVQLPLGVRNKIRQAFATLRRTHSHTADPSRLFFAPQKYRWFCSQKWPFDYDVVTWRSLSVPALRAYIPDSSVGLRILRAVNAVEDRLPHLCGRWGQYPLIVLRGTARGESLASPRGNVAEVTGHR